MEKLINEVEEARIQAEAAMGRLEKIDIEVLTLDKDRQDSYCPLCKVGNPDSPHVEVCENCASKLKIK